MLLDTFTAADGLNFTSSTPRTYMGDGFTNNTLPAGMTLLGRAFDEPMLFRLAYSYEQSTKHRRAPPSAP